MEHISEVVKKHPLAIGAGVILVLILLMRGGSSANVSGANSAAALASQKAAEATDVSIASINSQSATARQATMATMYAKAVDASTQAQTATNADAVALMLGMAGTAATVRQHDQQMTVANNQIAASQAIAAQGLDNQLQAHTLDVNAALTVAGQNYSINQQQLQIASDNLPQIIDYRKYIAGVGANEAIQLATVSGNTQVQVAQANGQTAQAVAALNTSAARTNANTAQTSSYFKDFADMAGIAMMFL